MTEQDTTAAAAEPTALRPVTQLEIDQRVFDLYDEYCHGRMDRREFLLQAAAVTAGGLAMAQALLPRYAQAQTISFTDQRIKARYVSYHRLLLGRRHHQLPRKTAAVPAIKAALLVQYAENDERINAIWPAYEAALKAASVRYEMHTCSGAQHGFHNNSTPRYQEASAKLAWDRTIAFFKKHLA